MLDGDVVVADEQRHHHEAADLDLTRVGEELAEETPQVVHPPVVDPAHPLAWGMGDEVDLMFANSPTFKLPAVEGKSKLSRVAWFDGKSPLRSGWAFGQEYLDGGTAVVDAKVGKGHVALYGPQVLFRAQPHATFKLVFNAIVRASEKEEAR